MHNICYHCRLVGQLACSIVVFNCLFVRVYSSRWCARSEGFWRKSGIWDGGEEGVSALCRIARFGIHRVATPILSTILRKIKWSQLQNNLMFHFCHFHHLFTRGCSLFCLDKSTNYFWDAAVTCSPLFDYLDLVNFDFWKHIIPAPRPPLPPWPITIHYSSDDQWFCETFLWNLWALASR